MKDEDIYEKAAKKVKAKKGFFYHLVAYACIVGMLYTILQLESNGEIIPVVVVGLSWGIGLASHYFRVFGTEHLDFLGFSSNWEEDELEKEIKRIKRKRELKSELAREKGLLDNAEKLELKEIEKRPLDDDLV
ncbi:MAG: 2TM domain-containing protein [Bacteroidota bacterium]